MTSIELNEILREEKRLYLGENDNQMKQMKKSHHKRYTIWRYMYYFRCSQYWREVRQNKNLGKMKRRLAKIKYKYYDRKRNIYSEKSGVEIGIDCKIGKNCDIWHSGIVINGSIGDNCLFHGNNIIGNKGKNYEKDSPVLGNNVDIGAGAVVIGELELADDCIVGAGSVVTKSFTEKGTVIVGVPGEDRKLRSK